MKMSQINAYLTFNGNCREAMTFYKKCLGGKLVLQTIGDSPMADKMPPQMKQNVLHSTLTKGALLIMASDMVSEQGLRRGNAVSLMLHCSSEEEINSYFSSLSAGGKIIDSLKAQFWGAIFGVFVDQFGIRWMLNYDKSQKS